jgi:hypothetical protein
VRLHPDDRIGEKALRKLHTHLSPKVKVKYRFLVSLRDADPDASNPYVVQPNINKGNKQIAHGINRVLRPVDLP